MAEKKIVSRAHLDAFLASQTHDEVLQFVEAMNESSIGITLQADSYESEAVKAILGILSKVDDVVRAHPPVENAKSRFGNPAFRDFYDDVVKNAPSWFLDIPNISSSDVATIQPYFCEAWGNKTRIDYGSGMELNFICWLLCLKKLQVLDDQDFQALAIKVFWKYIQVMRNLQSVYWLEPAGSHGAYGLDDYHFLPFVFGSAQLRTHKHIRPKAIHDKDVVDEFSKDYMYLACIQFVDSIKTASLRWHSPMLDDISAVKTWDKVNAGMMKMYKAEVLGKLPVAQHFLFGQLLPFPDATIAGLPEEDGVHLDDHGHVHVRGEGFGDCCGIPIPSAFAAAKEEQAKRQIATSMSSNVHIIPFD